MDARELTAAEIREALRRVSAERLSLMRHAFVVKEEERLRRHLAVLERKDGDENKPEGESMADPARS